MDEATPGPSSYVPDRENNTEIKDDNANDEIDDEIDKQDLNTSAEESKDQDENDEEEDGDDGPDAFVPMIGQQQPPAVEQENNNDQGPGDEIVLDLIHHENPFAQPPPVIDFNQLDNALQHVQGHMDNMMHNLGGLQTSVKHLKQNLGHYMRSSELDRNALRTSLHADIVQSWRDGTFSDLTLVDDSGLNHKVHKVVLASRSSYFRAQLTNWDKEDKVINVKIVSSDVLKIVIEFIYTLDVQSQITNANVVDLLQAANIYDLKLLREECVHFLRHRISLGNIIEMLTFSHIDHKLEVHATNFLARNFSRFLSKPDRKMEVLELPVDKMKMVLRSKLLILRDKNMFPVRAVVREVAILRFVLEYIMYREKSRISHSGELLSTIRFHLLPLDPHLKFPLKRYLPIVLLDFVNTKLSGDKFTEVRAKLDQIEADVRFLHVGSDKQRLYQNTFSSLVYVSGDNMIKTLHRNTDDKEEETMGDRNPGWDAACNREASICHEWWTAHAHDSRFVPSTNSSRTTKIVAVSGSSDGDKFIKRFTFYVGEVNDNRDLLPEWFNLAPQYQIQNMQQELGEYIGAMHIVWSTGKENWIGTPGPDLNKSRVTVALEEGEHIVRSYQLFWGPRQVFVPLEVVDFVFVTSRGRKFGPFTKQVRKAYQEAEGQKKEWSFTDIRHKLNSKNIQRRVDNPLQPMCRPASVGELSSAVLETDDDLSWSVWLDGFLCVVKNQKITRITLKFAVYLDCLYQEKSKPKGPGGSNRPYFFHKDVAPTLLSYTLDEMRENIKGRPIRIQDYDYLWDNIITPYAEEENEESDRCKRLRKMLEWNERGLLGEQDEENNEQDGAVAEPVEDNAINNLIEQDNEEEQNNNNADDENEGDHLHGDVWDALINDDLRAIGQLYEKKTLKIDEYLE